ncbi:hypothetical protein GCM10028798_05760 [Humibacter antri]
MEGIVRRYVLIGFHAERPPAFFAHTDQSFRSRGPGAPAQSTRAFVTLASAASLRRRASSNYVVPQGLSSRLPIAP